MDLGDLRRSYHSGSLDPADVDPSPVAQFHHWFAEVQAALPDSALPWEANTMTLATASSDAVPSARIVLLKAADERGFVFFTNRESDKGTDIAFNPRAALVFNWFVLDRQVRVSGTVAPTSDAETDAYFASRPAESRRGAWASQQSMPIADRAALEARFEEVRRRFPDDDAIPRPPFWGGYRVRPESVEFWQGRRDRLHDRVLYRRDAASPTGWRIERLQP
jgi:pyridoxamine 5'-phosphate oxidase